MTGSDAKTRHVPDLLRSVEQNRLSRREFVRLAALLGVAAPAAYAMVGEPFGEAAQAAAATTGGVVRIGHRVAEIKSPHALNWFKFANLTFPVVETLTVTGADNVTRPNLVESWSVSDDLKAWTFKLRQDVKWHSGRPFLADDVVWNFKHILDPATGSSTVGLMKSYMLNEVEKDGKKTTVLWSDNAIEKVDDHTFRFNLKVPQIAVPEHLFHYCNTMLDPAEKGVFGVGSNGTGPFTLVQFDVGKKAVYEARKDYWGDGPHLERLEFVDLGDNAAANISALVSGQVDGLYMLGFDDVKSVEGREELKIYNAKTANTATVSMKCTQKPWTDNRVRLAMRLSCNPGVVMKASTRGYGTVGEHHHVAPIHPDYAKLPPFVRDIAKAKALLAEAGYPDGLSAEISVAADPVWQPKAVEVMVTQWAEAGLNIKIQIVPTTQFWDIWDKAPLVYTDWSHRPLGVQMLSLVYRTGVPWNCAEWSNAEFDTLLTQAEGTVDVEKRRAIMAKLEAIMQDEGPVVLPVWTDLLTAYHKKVQGFVMHPSGVIFGNQLSVAAT